MFALHLLDLWTHPVAEENYERDRVGESGKNTLSSLASRTYSKFVYVHEIPLMVWVCAKALALDGNFIG